MDDRKKGYMSAIVEKISIMGCGWLGLKLGKELVANGFRVFGSTTSEEKLAELESVGIRPYLLQAGEKLAGEPGDFFKTDLLILNIPPGRRRPDVAERYPEEIRLVVDRARQDGIQRILFVSSTGVYTNEKQEVNEADPPDAKKGSGLALARCEDFLRQIPGIDLTILRFSGLAGGDRKPGRFLAGKKDLANGDAPVNMVHRDDCIAIMQAIIQQGVWGETFNISADEHPSRREFYQHQALKEGFDPPTFLEDNGEPFKLISNKKVKERLNYTFLHPDPMEF